MKLLEELMELNIEKFNPKKAELTELASKHRSLVINGTEDKEGYELVKAARKELQQTRKEIVLVAKAMREDAVKFQKEVIAYEKDLIEILEPVEKDLKDKTDAIDEAIEMEKRKKLVPGRLETLAEFGGIGDTGFDTEEEFLCKMNNSQFDEFLNHKRGAFFLKQQTTLREEREKLETEKRAVEEATREVEREKQKAIDIENARKEAEERAKRNHELELARVEADAKAKIDEAKRAEEQREQDRLKAEQDLALEAELKAKMERLEQAALERKKKYQKFLKDNGYVDDGTFIIKNDAEVVILYKKIGELKI